MLEFPRWKYVLVVAVVLLGLLFAVPNFFGEDLALQVERKNHGAMDDSSLQQVEGLLTQNQVPIKRSYVEGTRLMLAFADVPTQLRARDLVNDKLTEDYRSALAYAPRTPELLRRLGLKPMALGLDLRGGLYLLYQVDVGGAVSQLLETYEQGFRRTLADAKVTFTDIIPLRSSDSAINNGLRVLLPAGTDTAVALDALRRANTDLSFTTATADSGPTIDMVMTQTQIRTREQYALEQNRTTLTNRVNELGASEPIVQQQGADRINVQLPGVQNSAEVKDLLGKVATLEFRIVDSQNSAITAEQSGRVPLGDKLYKMSDGSAILLKRELIITGDHLTSATTSSGNEGPEVDIKLDSNGGDAMFRVTRVNVGKRMGIVYTEKSSQEVTDANGQKVKREFTTQKVISAATIQSPLGNNFRITGLSAGEGRDLALLIRSGSLAAPITPVEERAIGPSLGQQNIDMGVRALIIGMAAVFVFMALYYHAFGLVADAVLLANVVLLTALLSMLHASLSLPGIAGIILTVGIAVDANVLIYERIREELRNGVSPQAAIRAGFDKAFSAIFDSNVTAFIAGLALYVIGRGPIQNFAIVLLLGIATSMFTSLMGSRALITLMYGGRRRVERLSIG
jgi:preprotein translocase subunit SecD